MRRQQLTMIEVVVAVGLLSMVLSVLFMGTHSIIGSWQQVELKASEFEDVLMLDRAVDNLFSNVVPFTWPTTDETLAGRSVQFFDGFPNNVTFAYLHKVNRMEDGGLRFVHMRVDDGKLIAYYCSQPPFPEDLDDERVTAAVLSHNVAGIGFLYADVEDEQLVWVDDWEDRDYLPLAIQIGVAWEDGREDIWLRRTAGSSFLENWGVRDTTRRKFLTGVGGGGGDAPSINSGGGSSGGNSSAPPAPGRP
jgi:general secretion pathway protein J